MMQKAKSWAVERIHAIRLFNLLTKERSAQSDRKNDIDIGSRKAFQQQVKRLLVSKHAKKGSESFILGISGKWGEGKSTFLTELSYDLEHAGFTIISLNPWKFGDDKNAFMRNFVKSLYQQIAWPKRALYRLWCFVCGLEPLGVLDTDRSQSKINLFAIFGVSSLIALSYYLYTSWPELFRTIRLPLTLFAIPILTSMAGKVMSAQSSSKAISAVDEYDKVLGRALRALGEHRIVIYVDDLDRVSPSMARKVLDNLRTFFDKPELTFIVTGDHSVLEHNIGKELTDDPNLSAQLEEGKRFLKKIFDLYWRLPLPIEIEFADFIDKEIGKRPEIREFFDEEAVSILKSHLAKYFEKNFRHVIRFLDLLVFIFQAIKNQQDTLKPDKKVFFEEIFNYPLLLVRILMIQDLASPLFEAITIDEQKLFNLERAVEKKDSQNIQHLLNDVSPSLTPRQQLFLTRFMYTEPRFFEESSLRVKDLKPFLYFAADPGSGDASGPIPEDFIPVLDSGDPKQISNLFIRSGLDRLKELCAAAYKHIESLDHGNEQSKRFSSLANALLQTATEHPVHELFASNLIKFKFNLISDRITETNERMSAYISLWSWLDTLGLKNEVEYANLFPYTTKEDLDHVQNHITELSSGKITSLILSKWLADYYSTDKTDALSKMQLLLARLSPDSIVTALDSIARALVEDIITDSNETLRQQRLDVLAYSKTGKETLKERVRDYIKAGNNEIWNWSVRVSQQENPPWSANELENFIIEDIEGDTFLGTLNFGVGRISVQIEGLWNKIDQNFNRFYEVLPTIINDPQYVALAPNEKAAAAIYDKLLKMVTASDETTLATSKLEVLKRDKWLWHKLTGIPHKRPLLALAKKRDDLKQIIREVLVSWGIPEDELSQ